MMRWLVRVRGAGLLFWSLLVAVGALSAVSFFSDRVQRGLEREGASALAADLVVEHGDEAAFPGHGKSRDDELTRLKRELAQVKEERDFLKEAARYFAKESK